MKKALLIIFNLSLHYCIFGQVPSGSTGVVYSYDAHGNRVLRKLEVNIFERKINSGNSNENANDSININMKLAMDYGVSVFPNPTQTNITVTVNKELPDINSIAILSDNSGKILKTINNFKSKEEIQLDGYLPGIYFLSITFNKKDRLTYRIIKY